MSETEELDFQLTRRRAEREGYHVQRHKDYDPAQGGGDLYLMRTRKFRGEHTPTLLSYATSDEVHAYMNANPLSAGIDPRHVNGKAARAASQGDFRAARAYTFEKDKTWNANRC
jgi:hypothetical protein